VALPRSRIARACGLAHDRVHLRLHLQAAEMRTFEAWRAYMASSRADALFILGDLFEVWVGDDIAHAPGFAADCVAVLHATAHRLPVFIMHGNRDFLMADGPDAQLRRGVAR